MLHRSETQSYIGWKCEVLTQAGRNCRIATLPCNSATCLGFSSSWADRQLACTRCCRIFHNLSFTDFTSVLNYTDWIDDRILPRSRSFITRKSYTKCSMLDVRRKDVNMWRYVVNLFVRWYQCQWCNRWVLEAQARCRGLSVVKSVHFVLFTCSDTFAVWRTCRLATMRIVTDRRTLYTYRQITPIAACSTIG